MPRQVSLVIGYVIVCAASGAVGAWAMSRLPIEWNGALLAITAGLVTVLSAASFAVFSKLDGILKDSETNDSIQVRRIYRYVHELRIRLMTFLVTTVITGLTVGAIALLLPKMSAPHQTFQVLYGIGYAGAAFILLFMVRVAHVYAKLDDFRRELFDAIAAERRRVAALQELRPSILESFAKVTASVR